MTVILVPSHFLDDLTPLVPSAVRLVPYDRNGRPQGDSTDAAGLFRWWLTPEEGDALIRSHPDLRWIHSGSAGVDHILTPLFRGSRIVLSNSAGVHAPSIAEWVVAAMLSELKSLRLMTVQQQAKTFEKIERPELGGQEILFLGAGHIASEIALRLWPFGVSMTAIRKSGAAHPRFPSVLPPSFLLDAARKASWLIVTAPLTQETTGIVSRDLLAALPAHARVVNVSRGEVVNEDALVEAIREGRLAGAILDVFREEPLPPSHPFWEMPEVVVLPHTTWRSPEVKRRQVELFVDNLARFLDGRPLRNVVDAERGY